MSIEQAVIDAVNTVRKQLQRANLGTNSFAVVIKAEGRVNDGDVKISFEVGENTWSDKPSSHSLFAALGEYERRKGWSRMNEPLMISNYSKDTA